MRLIPAALGALLTADEARPSLAGRIRRQLTLLVLGGALSLAACGGGQSTSTEGQTPPVSGQPDPPAAPPVDPPVDPPPTGGGPVAGDVLVQLRAGADLPAVLAQYGLTQVSRFGARPIFRLQVSAGNSVDTVVASLLADPRVVAAEPNFSAGAPEARKRLVWAVGTPGQYSTQWAPAALHLPQAHALATGRGVRVAVLDTGIDASHPALSGRLLPGRDFIDDDDDPSEEGSVNNGAYGHGTHVAGLVALAAPDAMIMPLRVLDSQGESNVWVLAEALLYAVDPDGIPATPDGARVINMSLGTLDRTSILELVTRLATCNLVEAPDPNAPPPVPLDDPGYQGDEDRCTAQGSAVVVAAAGNSGSDKERQYPAAEGAYGSLAVAASTAAGGLASFSNSDNWINVAAPGEGIVSLIPGGGYASWSGTSMATPLVAGLAALLIERNPAWEPDDVTDRLENTTVPLCGTQLRQVNAEGALLDLELAGPTCGG